MILFIIGALFVLIALAILIFSDDAKRTAIIPAVVAVIFIGISCVSYGQYILGKPANGLGNRAIYQPAAS